MTKEEFIKIRSQYNKDIDCIKALKVGKKKFYEWKEQFGLTKRSKKDAKQKEWFKSTVTAEEISELLNKFGTNEKCAKYLKMSTTNFQALKTQAGLSRIYDHSEINHNDFIKLYNQGLNDQQIAKILNTNGKRICAFRSKLNLDSNTINKYEFTEDQFQIFLGGMLGDSCLVIPKGQKNALICFAHSLKQESYAKWKHSFLKDFCSNPIHTKEFDKRNGKTYHQIRVQTRTAELFTKYLPLFYKIINGKKVKYINKDLLWQLKPLGIAVWFMDDGYKEECGYALSTNCFSDEDLDIIVEFFEQNYQIKPRIHKSNILYIGAKYKDLFTKIIEPYIQPELQYKLHSASCINSVNLETSSNEDNPNPSALEIK